MLNDEFEYPSECMICYCEFNNENTPYNLISHDFQCMHIYCFDCINKIDQCSLCRKNKIGITKNILLMQYLKLKNNSKKNENYDAKIVTNNQMEYNDNYNTNLVINNLINELNLQKNIIKQMEDQLLLMFNTNNMLNYENEQLKNENEQLKNENNNYKHINNQNNIAIENYKIIVEQNNITIQNYENEQSKYYSNQNYNQHYNFDHDTLNKNINTILCFDLYEKYCKSKNQQEYDHIKNLIDNFRPTYTKNINGNNYIVSFKKTINEQLICHKFNYIEFTNFILNYNKINNLCLPIILQKKEGSSYLVYHNDYKYNLESIILHGIINKQIFNFVIYKILQCINDAHINHIYHSNINIHNIKFDIDINEINCLINNNHNDKNTTLVNITKYLIKIINPKIVNWSLHNINNINKYGNLDNTTLEQFKFNDIYYLKLMFIGINNINKLLITDEEIITINSFCHISEFINMFTE